jgi:hypothetical protein
MAEVKIKTGERETKVNRTVLREVITSMRESGNLIGAAKYAAKSDKKGKSSNSNASLIKK